MDWHSYLNAIILILAVIGLMSFVVQKYKRIQSDKLQKTWNVLLQDQKGRQLYIHQSHILMAGYGDATECINCGGNSKTAGNLEKLIVPCSMELSVYDGNNKFKHSTGETNV